MAIAQFNLDPEQAKIVRQEMEQAHSFRVPIVAEVVAGPNWRDMQEV